MFTFYFISCLIVFSQFELNAHSYNNPQRGITTVDMPDIVKTDPKYRIDCAPDIDEYHSFCELNLSQNRTTNVTNSICTARGCVWDPNAGLNITTCYIPLEKGGYGLVGEPNVISNTTTRYTLNRQAISAANDVSLFNRDIDDLDVQVSISDVNMVRMTIRDANSQRYEVPVPIRWNPLVSSAMPPRIQFQMTKTTNDQVGFRVRRTNTQSIIFDTTFFANGFIYDDNFLQLVTTIPSRNIYGFGENTHRSFRHILKQSYRYAMFARDQWPTGVNENLYGVHPFYMVIESDGQAFGIFILNSNAQDYKFDEFDTNQAMLTYRTIGGILDIMVFAGPTPEQVIQQYQSVIGKPYMPPYWALGFQLSRYGYNSLKNMKAAMNRTLNANIPLDIMYGDIDYFYKRLDFTWNPVDFDGLPEYVDWLHENGMKFITILDPAIDSEEKNYLTFTEGQKANIWIKWPEDCNLQLNETGNRNMLGYVWPDGKTVFPDFFYPATSDWWKSEIRQYYSKLKFDGLWIDMNEPANFDTNKDAPWNWNRPELWNLHCPIDKELLENPPYKTAICGDYLSDKTLCMIGEQTNGRGQIYKQYNAHSLYGWSEALVSLAAARTTDNKRSVVISRSTFPSSGAYGGHWLGDNAADWSHLKYNIIGMLEFNLFGIPYIGADICGYFNNATEEMCQRWMQLGAFNPFFRNHNGFGYIDQDPGIFSAEAMASNRRAVELRYTLIPYLYTLFHRVHISGGTVVRSMAHVFPSDAECLSLDEQFLWGSSLLIAPVIYENHVNKSLYLPTTDRWFDYYTGEEQLTTGKVTISAPLEFMPLYLRGGAIIPHQQSAVNTVAARKKPLYLIVALDSTQYASGELFWDDGDSIDTYQRSIYNYFLFNHGPQHLTIQPWVYKYPQMSNETKLDEIRIYGRSTRPARILWNGQEVKPVIQWTYNTTTNVLTMTKLALNMSKTHRFTFL
ncbi:unnamed protein product [Adineta ricciae]|uniref:Maltase n=1 Tax=Adineta ricciae TaxID=249248 RepID=A0A815JS38_ADIRI|nr:unnamed protein product [Adineta ricciae]